MGSRPRSSFVSQQYRDGTDVFFPRNGPTRVRDFDRLPRGAPAVPPTFRGRIEPEFRPARGFEPERKREYPNGRELDRTRGVPDKRSSDARYDRREGVRRDDSRDVGRSAPRSESDGHRYKYLDEGWYNAYKSQPPPGSNPNFYESTRERDFRASRNGNERQGPKRSATDRHGADMGQYGVVNSEIVMETRQLEERVAAIQRELEMLEKDNEGSRSADYRRSRSVYPANPSGNLPSLLDFAPPPDAVEKARFEREEVNLRLREQELRRREEELMMEQRRALRERAAPPLQYGRVAPPGNSRSGTFPKLRSFAARRTTVNKRTNSPPPRRRITGNRKNQKTQAKKRKDVKLPEKSKTKVAKREVKEENASKKKKLFGAEDSSKKSEHDRTTDGLVEQILGKYQCDGDSPRSRSLKQVLEFCDTSLLGDEVCQKAGILIAKSGQPVQNDYMNRTCIRIYNPTVLGPLDQYVPLGLFEQEVKMDTSRDGESDKILEHLQEALAVFPRSPTS